MLESAKQREAGLMTFEQAEAVVDRHINRLHEYNEVKDIGQLIFGKCAELVIQMFIKSNAILIQ